jgi:ABC-type amino acid transport system permease subunit
VAFILNDPSRLSAAMIPNMEILFGIIIGVVFKSYKMFDYKWLGFYIVFIIVWFVIGLPVSVSIKNLNPMTEFYYNPMVNAIEIMQWFVGLFMFVIGFKFELEVFK